MWDKKTVKIFFEGVIGLIFIFLNFLEYFLNYLI